MAEEAAQQGQPLIAGITVTGVTRGATDLYLSVGNIGPNGEPSTFQIPFVCLADRRIREAIPPCGDCVARNVPTIHAPVAEVGDWTHRPALAHDPAAHPDTEQCLDVSLCACGGCPCCAQALEILIAEHLAIQRPDLAVAHFESGLAKRFGRNGAIPGHHWCSQHDTLEADGFQHAAPDATPGPRTPHVRGILLRG